MHNNTGSKSLITHPTTSKVSKTTNLVIQQQFLYNGKNSFDVHGRCHVDPPKIYNFGRNIVKHNNKIPATVEESEAAAAATAPVPTFVVTEVSNANSVFHSIRSCRANPIHHPTTTT